MGAASNVPELRVVPSWIVCPRCRGDLQPVASELQCSMCARSYPRRNGFLDLIEDPADRFQDERDEERDLTEEHANTFSTLNYCLPLARRLLGNPAESSEVADRPRILSNGCGVAVDVDLFNEYGFAAYGIDCGQRTWSWSRRRYPDRLYVANAKALPFADTTFDLVTAGCLLPHVGVIGDTTAVVADYREQRNQVAREMVRVVKPGGYIVVASPNRPCPLDMWHLHHNPGGVVRLHSPGERFLCSFDDYAELFVRGAGCRSIETLPLEPYFSFRQKARHPWQRFLVGPVQLYFRLLSSRAGAWLRPTALNPWLVVLVRR